MLGVQETGLGWHACALWAAPTGRTGWAHLVSVLLGSSRSLPEPWKLLVGVRPAVGGPRPEANALPRPQEPRYSGRDRPLHSLVWEVPSTQQVLNKCSPRRLMVQTS